MTEYHEDSKCGACDGPLEVHRDAICETCHSTSKSFEEAFAEQYWERFPAMQKEITGMLIEILEQMAGIARMNTWRRRLRFRRKG